MFENQMGDSQLNPSTTNQNFGAKSAHTVGGVLMGTSTPKAISDIGSAFNQQAIVLDILQNKVSILKEKLAPIMISVPENVAKASSDFNGSPLSQEINQKTLRIENLDKEIAYILDSLQL